MVEVSEVADAGVSLTAYHRNDEQQDSGSDAQRGPKNAKMTEPLAMSTPVQLELFEQPMVDWNSYTGPVTRSMAKVSPAGPSEHLSSTTAQFNERLQNSSKKLIRSLNVSKLEDSRDVSSIMEDQEDELDGELEEMEGDADEEMTAMGQHESLSLERTSLNHPLTGQLRMPLRRSARVNNLKLVPTEDADLSVISSVSKRARIMGKKSNTTDIVRHPVRRSPRFSKPLTEFHKYSELPPELKMMIWEAVVEPRLIYISNRYSACYPDTSTSFEIQNEQPPWFTTCRLSVWVAQRHYRNLFPMFIPYAGGYYSRTIQPINVDMDIIIFEPCHNACRGCYCARNQYYAHDRETVQSLVVQTESPTLQPTIEPCWETVTRSWPNVETLYLMRDAVKGVDKRNKAMIRVKNNDHETNLLKEFSEWKKSEEGIDSAIEKLEFVVIVEKEVSVPNKWDRYKSVEDRMTGQVDDIIIG